MIPNISREKIKSIFPYDAFEYFDYRLLWLSGVAATLTMSLRMIITGVWLYEETGLGSTLAYLGLVELAVRIPSNLYGGVFADRLDRKKMIGITQFFSFFLIGIMALFETIEILKIWHVYAITGILSATSIFGGPARSALTARVVPRKILGQAVAMNTITWQVGSILTPFIFLVTSFGESLAIALWITTAIAIVSVLAPFFIRQAGAPENITKTSGVNKNLIEGFKYVIAHPILPGLYLLDIGVTVVSYYRELFPIFAKQLYSRGRDAVSLMTAFNSIGAILGSLLVIYTHKVKRKGVVVLYATLFYAFILILFGWSTSLWIGLFSLVALGAADAVGMTMRQTIVQLTTPDHLRGRATAAHSLAAMSANGIGKWEVGYVSDVIGAGNTLIIGGFVSIIVVLIIWYGLSGIRNYSYVEENE